MKARGADPSDARTVFAALRETTRKPDAWRDFFETGDQDSHDYWKKEKTKEEVERLRLANAKSAGDMFDRVDGEAVMVSWASALNLALAELKATLPPQMAGLDEASVEVRLDEEFRKLQENLSDLESQLWQKVYDKYRTGIEEAPADETSGGDRKAPAKKDRKPVVQRPR